jgi:hypothetical protein
MSTDTRFDSCGRDEPAEPLAVENFSPGPASAQQAPAPADRNPAVFQVSAADVIQAAPPPLPRLQTFEELGLPAAFQTTVGDELSRDEKLVWLGRPSQNPAVYPPKTILVVVGAVLVGLAILLPWVSAPLIFSVVLVILGLLFVCAPKLSNGTNIYSACYVVTNRRVLLLEKGLIGVDAKTITSWKSLTGVRCKSYLPHELLGMERRNNERVPGAGDLIFEYIFTIGQNTTAFPSTTGTVQRTDAAQRVPRGFCFLDQVAEVENVIRATLLTGLEKSLDERLQAPAPATRPVPQAASPLSTVNCACGAAIQAPDALAGQSVKCPRCGSALAVPGRAAAPTAAAGAGPYREHGRVPADLKEKVLAELGTNERLVWLAQPVGAIVFRRSLGYLVGGGVVAAVALGWLLLAIAGGSAGGAFAAKKGAAVPQAKTPPAARAFDLVPIVLLVGAACCLGVPFYRRKMAQRSCYALTNRRALVLKQGLFGAGRESYSPVEVARMRRRDCWLSQGEGDLIFHTVVTVRTSYGGRGAVPSRSVTTTHYGFLAIAHVKEVEKLVRETLINPFVDKLQMASSL